MNKSKSTNLVLYTDGGSRGNPGPAAAGVVVLDDQGKILKTANRYLGETTNNQAEYRALLLGFETIKKLNPVDSTKDIELEVFMDSELIVKQMKGEYKVKAVDLQPLYLEVRNLSGQFGKVSFTHVRREKNSHADALVNQALDRLGK